MGSGKPKPGRGGMQLPDIIKNSRVLIKLKKEWRKSESGRGERRLGIETKKGKDGFQDGGMGEVDAQALLEIYKEQKQLREVRKRTEQTRFRWQWSECFREDERDRKQILNKGLRTRHCKNLECKAKLLKLNSAVQQQGRKEATIESNKEFNNESKPLPDALLDYLNSIEILNRQSLPLRSNYNRKVQEYFNKK
jgi:hypothetical protein